MATSAEKKHDLTGEEFKAKEFIIRLGSHDLHRFIQAVEQAGIDPWKAQDRYRYPGERKSSYGECSEDAVAEAKAPKENSKCNPGAEDAIEWINRAVDVIKAGLENWYPGLESVVIDRLQLPGSREYAKKCTCGPNEACSDCPRRPPSASTDNCMAPESPKADPTAIYADHERYLREHIDRVSRELSFNLTPQDRSTLGLELKYSIQFYRNSDWSNYRRA